MTKNLDHVYDEFLKANNASIIPAIEGYNQRLRKASFRYGRFTIPTFYKPHLINSKQEHMLKSVSLTINQVINTATRLFFEEGHMAHLFRVKPDAAELIHIDPGYSRSVVISRFDAILEGMLFKLLDFNCDAPAGMAYADQVESVLLQEEPLKSFFEEYPIQSVSRSQHLLDSLLETYEEFGGYENPQIAIVDWRHVRTKHEFQCLKGFFESKGYKTTIADPRDLKYKGRKLYHKDFRVHLIYRRATFDEILQRADEVTDMLKAYRDKAVCMVNPLRARLATTKAFLSILTNPEFDHFFTDNENKVKANHIPWTRRLTDAEDFYGRKKVYLIDFLKDEKETLILKPAMGIGGRGVTIGCETRDEDWNAAIDKALKGDWVVQEYVKAPIITVPTLVNNKLDFAYKKYNFNLLVFGGKYSGGFARLSDESVVNVAKSGGLIPSLACEHVPERLGV